MRENTYIVNGERFATKKSLQNRIRGILYGYRDGDTISSADLDFMSDLLTFHQRYEQKCGVGIWYMTVRKNPVYGTMGFWLTRLDGSETDFSFMECLMPTGQRKKFERACRAAVAPDVVIFRHRFFENSSNQRCPYTGEEISERMCHIHHRPPWTFQALVCGFIDDMGIDIDRVHILGEGIDGMVQDRFADCDLEQSWIRYHNDRATLEVVSRRANLSDLKKQKSP